MERLFLNDPSSKFAKKQISEDLKNVTLLPTRTRRERERYHGTIGKRIAPVDINLAYIESIELQNRNRLIDSLKISNKAGA